MAQCQDETSKTNCIMGKEFTTIPTRTILSREQTGLTGLVRGYQSPLSIAVLNLASVGNSQVAKLECEVTE